MHRFRIAALSAAAAAGLAGPALAADSPPEKMTLVKKLFGPSTPKPVGPTVRSGSTLQDRPMTVSAPLPAKALAEALQAEQEAYLRRVSVCTELRRIAVERGDDSLVRQADELERQAGSLYNARVAVLGVSRTKAPLPEPTARAVDVSTDIGVAANKLVAPSAPVPGTTTAEAKSVKPREITP